MMYDYNDYILCQAPIGLNSRSEVNLEYTPLMTAPMTSVVGVNNMTPFTDLGISVCLPRYSEIEISDRYFTSFGLTEFENLIHSGKDLNHNNILCDVANGNMPKLHELIRLCKQKYPKSMVMSGNVASLEAFIQLESAGCDIIRLGVGNGNGCLTSVQTGVGQGMATLIQRCYNYKINNQLNVTLVADGGCKSYRDIVIALACGADYVMVGSLFAKSYEGAGKKTFDGLIPNSLNLNNKNSIKTLIKSKRIKTEYYGMSTKKAQKEWGKEQLKTSEGVEREYIVEYMLEDWYENFEAYLKSAMSYVGAKTLANFRGSDLELTSQNVINRYNK